MKKDSEHDALVGTTAAEKGAADALPPTPMGVSRYALFGLYMLAIALTGMPPCATDPLIQLMQLNNAAADILDPTERLAKISSIAGFGMTCVVLVGIFVGPMLNVLGAKIGALTGIALHVTGYLCMFMTNFEPLQWFAGLCFGMSFQLILNAHLSVGVLFPRNASFVLAGMSAGPDLSLFIPPFMLRMAEKSGDVKRAVFYQVCIYATIAVAIDLLFLPTQPFQAVTQADETEAQPGGETEALFNNTEESPAQRDQAKNELWTLPVSKQVLTSKFLFFLPFFLLSYARKKHFATFIRPTLEELDDEIGTPNANKLVTTYNMIVPYGFVPAMLWGAAVDKLGANNMLLASAVLAASWSGLLVLGIMSLQWVTVGIFIIWQCFIFGMALGFLANAFGFATLPTLQGLSSCITGLFSVGMDIYWPTFITHHLGTFHHASTIVFGISLGCLAIPVALMFT